MCIIVILAGNFGRCKFVMSRLLTPFCTGYVTCVKIHSACCLLFTVGLCIELSAPMVPTF